MKYKILILTFFLSLSLFSQSDSDWNVGYMFIHENTIPLDKQKHMSAGMFLGSMTYLYTYQKTGENRSKSKFYAIAVPTILSIIKESFDTTKHNGKFDFADIGYTVGTAIVFTYTFDFLVYRAKKRNTKNKYKFKKR